MTISVAQADRITRYGLGIWQGNELCEVAEFNSIEQFDLRVLLYFEYLSIWTGILLKRDRWEMSIETGYKVRLTL